MNLEAYAKAAAKLPPNPFYKRVRPFLTAGRILDIGAGVGTGVKYLLDEGFEVLALDQDPRMVALTRLACGDHSGLTLLEQPFLLPVEQPYDHVLAVFSLFFEPESSSLQLWSQIEAGLRPGAIFGGQFLGPDDNWVLDGASSVTRDDLDSRLANFDVIELEEVNSAGKTVYGEAKHWHVFHVIARKRG